MYYNSINNPTLVWKNKKASTEFKKIEIELNEQYNIVTNEWINKIFLGGKLSQ